MAKVSEHKSMHTSANKLQDSEPLADSHPAWITWDSYDSYLSADFYDPTSTSSYSKFKRWIQNDPLMVNIGMLATYAQVELVVLGLRLAFQAIWIVQLPEQYCNVPSYIVGSSYPFSEYEQLSHCAEDLVSGCAKM